MKNTDGWEANPASGDMRAALAEHGYESYAHATEMRASDDPRERERFEAFNRSWTAKMCARAGVEVGASGRHQQPYRARAAPETE